jgi:hypothetical protein
MGFLAVKTTGGGPCHQRRQQWLLGRGVSVPQDLVCGDESNKSYAVEGCQAMGVAVRQVFHRGRCGSSVRHNPVRRLSLHSSGSLKRLAVCVPGSGGRTSSPTA